MPAVGRNGKLFRPELYIYYMFNSGTNASGLRIIVYYIIPAPGFLILKLHSICETILVQAIGVAT